MFCETGQIRVAITSATSKRLAERWLRRKRQALANENEAATEVRPVTHRENPQIKIEYA